MHLTTTPAPLRVLYVAEAFGGGLFEITRKKAEGLAERGHEVAIAYGVRPETPADPRAVIDDRVELLPMPWTSRAIGAQVQALRALRSIVDGFRPDVVHLMSSFAGLHGALGIDRRRVPTIYTPQGYAFTMTSESRLRRAAYRLAETFIAHRVSVVGACSQTEGDQARGLGAAQRVEVIENGITELDGVPPTTIQLRNTPLVVAIGRPSPQRQPEACARILSAVSDLASVRWIGGGPAGAGTRTLGEHGVPITGWLPRGETLDAMARASVYLHWTAWDGLPLSILEALARDTIVVASDIGPNREVLGPEQVCTTEEEAIALVRRILTEPELNARLLAHQRAVRRAYGANRMVDRWVDLYSNLAGHEQVARPILSDAA